MTSLWSDHLIVNGKLPDDCRHVRDFIDADFFRWGGIYTLFLKRAPSTNANIFSRCYAHFGKTLNITTANDSTFTVLTLALYFHFYERNYVTFVADGTNFFSSHLWTYCGKILRLMYDIMVFYYHLAGSELFRIWRSR